MQYQEFLAQQEEYLAHAKENGDFPVQLSVVDFERLIVMAKGTQSQCQDEDM